MKETLYISGTLFFLFLTFKFFEVSDWIATAGMCIVSAVFAILLFEGLKKRKQSKKEYRLYGYCKECKNSIHSIDLIDETGNIYECPRCGHPHCVDELTD